MFDPTPLEAITEDHAALRWMSARIGASRPDAVCTYLFDDFAAVLSRHLAVIDGVIADVPGSRLRREFLDTHWYLKRSLASLQDMARDSEPFRKRLFALVRRLEHQMMAESTELVAALQPPVAHHAPE